MTRLEHTNLTVGDADAFAEILCTLFDWRIRWSGTVMGGAGRSVHVGGDDSYLALYQPATKPTGGGDSYAILGGLNHLGVVVADLATTEARVVAAGFVPKDHADYAPGRRFYFDGPEGLEIEVVAYD